jgi:YD repeat-containing protein
MQPVQSFRRLCFKVTFAPLLILAFLAASPSFAQSCDAPVISAINGIHTNGYWFVGNPNNITVSPSQSPGYWATPALMESSFSVSVANAVQAENPGCEFSVVPSLISYQGANAFQAAVSWNNCRTPVNILGINSNSGSSTVSVFAYYFQAWLCLQSGYTSGGFDGSQVFSNGACYLTNPELSQCGGSGTGGNAGVTIPVPSKTDGECPTCAVGNPITVATGNKFQKEVDYPAQAPDALTFIRYYNSDQWVPKGSLGPQWRGTFDRTIVLSNDSSLGNTSYSGPLLALAYRPDGRVITFNIAGSTPVATDPDTVETLTHPTPTTWTLTTQDDTVESYTQVTAVKSTGPISFGELTGLQFRSGITETMAYNASQNLTSVTDSFGQTLTLAYDSSNRI